MFYVFAGMRWQRFVAVSFWKNLVTNLSTLQGQPWCYERGRFYIFSHDNASASANDINIIELIKRPFVQTLSHDLKLDRNGPSVKRALP